MPDLRIGAAIIVKGIMIHDQIFDRTVQFDRISRSSAQTGRSSVPVSLGEGVGVADILIRMQAAAVCGVSFITPPPTSMQGATFQKVLLVTVDILNRVTRLPHFRLLSRSFLDWRPCAKAPTARLS